MEVWKFVTTRAIKFATLAIFAVCIFAISLHLYTAMSGDTYLRGADAYYYALQSKYWAETGEVRIPDSSFIHRAAGLLQRTGISAESSVRLLQTAIISIATFLAFLIPFISRYRLSIFQWFMLMWLAISPSVLFTTIEFPKMFSLLCILPVWLYPLIRDERRWYFSIIIAFLSCFLHRSAIPLATVFSIACAFAYFRPFKKIDYKIVGLALFSLLIIGGTYAFFISDRFHIEDLARISFKNVNLGVAVLFLRTSLPQAIKLETVLAMIFFFSFMIYFWITERKKRLILLIPLSLVLPALFPTPTKEVFGIGERYGIAVSYIILICGLFISTKVVTRERSPRPLYFGTIISLLLILVIATPFRLNLAHPKKIDPNFAEYDRVVSAIEEQEIPMLIAHKGIAYFYKYRTGREAFPFEPEDHWNKEKIWRILYRINPEELNYYLDDRCKWSSGLLQNVPRSDYHIIREDCWNEMRAKITPDQDGYLYYRSWETWLNPSKKRPPFLYRKHKGDDHTEFSALP